MKTRGKLKHWFKETNHTISKFFQKRDSLKAQKANAGVNPIPNSVEVIYKKKTHNKLKANKEKVFRHSRTKSRGKSSRKRKEDTRDLNHQSFTSKQASSKLERITLVSSGGSQLQSEKIYDAIKKDRDFYKKLLQTLQIAALIRGRKRDVDDLHKHTFTFRKHKGGKSIRVCAIEKSPSETSLSKSKSSGASAKEKAILGVRNLLRTQKVFKSLEITTNPKGGSSKASVDKISYSSLKAKISQIRRFLVERKSSTSAKEKCGWGEQIIFPTYVIQTPEETDAKSEIKTKPLIEPNSEECELRVKPGLACSQNPLIKQDGIPKEIASCRKYVADKSLTPKTSTKERNSTKLPQEGTRSGQVKPNETSKIYVTERPPKTQDSPKQDLRCGQSTLIKQKKNSSATKSCRSSGSDGPSKKTQDTQEGQSPLIKDRRFSAEITESSNVRDEKAKTTKTKTQGSTKKLQEWLRNSSQSLKQNRPSNETSRNYASESKIIPKSQNSKPLNAPDGEGCPKDFPPVITIKDPRSFKPSSDCSAYKNELDSCKCDNVKSHPVRDKKCPNENAIQSSTPSKKKSSWCFRCHPKKSRLSRPSSATTLSRNTSSHSRHSSPSGKKTSTSTPQRATSSIQMPKTQLDCNPNKVTRRSSPSPLATSPTQSKKSSTSYCGRPKSKKSKSPPPSSIERPKRGSTVSFSDAPYASHSRETCKAQKLDTPRRSSSNCYPRPKRTKPSSSPKSSKSKGPHFCTSCKRKSEMRVSQKKITSYMNRDLQRPPTVQPVLGVCTLKTRCTLPMDLKYAIVRISYFKCYTTYEMMRSSFEKPKNMPDYVEKIFVTKETKFPRFM